MTIPWYAEPTPQELADNLRSAIDWTQQNRKRVESNVIHIYAWNETGECAGLVPKLDEGTARLDAISRVLTSQHDSSNSVRSNASGGRPRTGN
jgi:hypothetical protein